MKKMVICLLLALLCLLPCTTALAAETGSENNTTTPTADDPYYKGESDDNSDADDLQWYRDNAALLENNNIVGDALRSVSWSITGLVCKVANVAETLYTKTFGLIDITNYPQINDLLDTLRPVLLALTVLCCAGLGIMLLVQHEKRPPLLRNILLGIVAVSASAWLFSTANDLVIAFRDGILGGEEVNQSYELVESNLIDLIRIDKRGDINALNYKAGQGVIYGVGIASQDDMDSIDLCETLDWHTAKNGKNLYGWSTAFNNRVKYRLAHTADGDVARKNYDGLTSANIGNQFFYRYSFDFWSCLLQLLSLSLLFLALCYKNVRIAYELVVSRLLAFLFAADIGGGEKLKNTLLFVRDTYLTMCVCVLSVKLYEIMVGLVTSFGITGIGKGIVCLLIAYAVIDGPNLVERILGMDAGLSSSVGRAMALFGAGKAAGRTAARLGGKAVRGVKNTAMAAATGTTLRQRQSKGSTGEQFGKGIHQRFHREDEDTRQQEQPSRQQEQQEQTRSARPKATEPPAAGAEAAAATEAAPAKPQPFPTDFMDAGTAGTSGGSNFGNSVPEVKKRVSNPAFSEAVKRLTPGPESSAEERKDFNRQVTAIVRGRKHRAIQPPVGADLYQVKNYEKALELGEYTLTITSWDWAEKDRAFEIIFEVKDLSLNREPGYTFRFRCGDSHYRYKIYRDLGDLLVVRVSGVSSRFAQVAMTVKAGSASRSIYMDDRTMAHVERLEERSDAAYRIHAVEGKAAGHRLALQQLGQQTEEKNADLRLAYEKLEALQASKADKTPQQQEEIDANLRTMAEKQGRLQNELEDMMLRKQALQAQLEQEEQLLARMQEGGDGA